MAILLDGATASEEAAAGGGRTSFSFIHSSWSNPQSNRLLIVVAKIRAASAITLTSLTADSVGMTKITGASAINEYSTGNWINIETWYLRNPAVAPTIAGTYSAEPLGDEVTSIVFTHVDPRTPIGVVNTATGSSTTPSVTLGSSSLGSHLLFACAKRRGAGGTFNMVAAGLNQLTNDETGTGSAGDLSYCDGNMGPVGTTGGTLAPAHDISSQWTAMGIEIRLEEKAWPPIRRRQAYLRM